MKKRGPWFRKAPPLAIELLEVRVTPASIFALWDGTLSIDGTEQADRIHVTPRFPRLDVMVNDNAWNFAAVDVLRVHIHARGGNDIVMLSEILTIGVWISAGPGDDIIQGGAANDFLEGDTGNDLIMGATGDDVISGGLGDDTIMGGAGNDEIDGDLAADPPSPNAAATISAIGVIGAVTAEADLSANAEPITPADNAEPADSDAPGDDRLLGDSGDDTVRGGEGNDLILGGAGNDRLYGQAGNDRLRGGSGADLVEGGPGVDHLAGNSGKDTVNGDAADSTANRPPVVNPIRPVDPPVSNPNASSIDELLAIVQPGITLPNPRPDTGTGTSGGTPVAVPVLPVVAPFEGSIAAAPVQAGVGGSGSAAVGPSGTVLPSDSSNLTNVPVLTGHSPNPISAQIDLVLQGALLTEATSDAPGQDQNGISKKERRRPTFLYIKPIPLPDLVPDIQLPLPG